MNLAGAHVTVQLQAKWRQRVVGLGAGGFEVNEPVGHQQPRGRAQRGRCE
jgi:hypothetical protein